MTLPSPVSVVLAFEPGSVHFSECQNIVADRIRENFAEIIKLSPADRKVRIDQILRGEK